MGSVGVQRDVTVGWKNYSGVPKKKTVVPKVGRGVDIFGLGTGSLESGA